jgi:hypothetical protein
MLMEVIQDHMLFNGEVAQSISQHTSSQIKHLFHAWKSVKAGDTSPVGTFKTSTIEALHKAIDEKKEGLFPSLKAQQ